MDVFFLKKMLLSPCFLRGSDLERRIIDAVRIGVREALLEQGQKGIAANQLA